MKGTAEVLLVDDNPADLELTSDALSRSPFPHRVRTVPDGEEALEFLYREGKYAGEDTPDLVILDLNLPRKHGRTVLSAVKADPNLRNIPVIIFSTSKANHDISSSYELGANSYVSKPGNLQDYFSTIASIGEFWLGCARLPHQEET